MSEENKDTKLVTKGSKVKLVSKGESKKKKTPEQAKEEQKIVKMRALGPLIIDGESYEDGDVIELPYEVAAPYLPEIKGNYAFSGQRYDVDGDVKRYVHKMAELVPN